MTLTVLQPMLLNQCFVQVVWNFEKMELLLQPLKSIEGHLSLKKWKIVINCMNILLYST